MRNLLNTKHIVETNTTYWEHFNHSIIRSMWSLFYTLTCLIDLFYTSNYTKNIRSEGLKFMYDDLLKRWNKAVYGNDDERREQRENYRNILKEIEKGVIKPYTKIQWLYEFFILTFSSLIHGVFPEILVDHAAKQALKMYLVNKNFSID